MSRNLIVTVTALSLVVGGTGFSQQKTREKQVNVKVRFLTVSNDLLEDIGVSLKGGSDGGTDPGSLSQARDGLSDLATSPLLSGQTGLVLKGGDDDKSGDGGKPGLEIAGVDKNGRIRFKPQEGMKVEIWEGLMSGSGDDTPPEPFSGGEQKRVSVARAVAFEPDVLITDEPLKELDAATVGTIEDTIEDLKRQIELQDELRSAYTELTQKAKDNPTEGNREAAAEARRSIQTVIYQKAVFEAALNYTRELAKVINESGSGGLPDVSALPEDDALRKKAAVHQRAVESLKNWESKRGG